jgi:myo-inositol-1-phosphate synthase
MIDAIRCAKIALDRGLSGPILEPSSYFMKTPPKQYKDEIAREKTEAFIRGDA